MNRDRLELLAAYLRHVDMNRDLLERLAAYLRHDVAAERFNMCVWADGPLEECGTAGCAGGWATVLFREKGLRLEGMPLSPTYMGKSGMVALMEFLGLDFGEVGSIFCPARYPGISPRITPAMVADRIEEILHRTEERR